MTKFANWLENSEISEYLFESMAKEICVTNIFSEVAEFVFKLLNENEEDEDEDDEPVELDDPFAASDEDIEKALSNPVEIDPSINGQSSDSEESEDWWRTALNKTIDRDGIIMYPKIPNYSNLFNDDKFKKAFTDAFKSVRHHSIHLRSKRVQEFKDLNSGYVSLVKSIKERDGIPTIKEKYKLNLLKQKIFDRLKKLGYCSKQEMEDGKFTDKIKDCIKTALEESGNTVRGTFNTKEYKESLEQFWLMLEVAIRSRLRGSFQRDLRDRGIDPDDYAEFLRELITNVVTSRVSMGTVRKGARVRKKWGEVDTSKSSGILQYVGEIFKKSKSKFLSRKASEYGVSASRGEIQIKHVTKTNSMIRKDIESKNSDVLNVYRYEYVDAQSKYEIDSFINSQVSSSENRKEIKIQFERRKEVSKNLKKVAEVTGVDISTINTESGLLELLNSFIQKTSYKSRVVKSIDDPNLERANQRKIDAVGDTSKIGGFEDPDGLTGGWRSDSDGDDSSEDDEQDQISTRNLATSSISPQVIAIRQALESLAATDSSKQPKYNNLTMGQLRALTIALSMGFGWRFTPNSSGGGNLDIDTSSSSEIEKLNQDQIAQKIQQTFNIQSNIPRPTVAGWLRQGLEYIKNHPAVKQAATAEE